MSDEKSKEQIEKEKVEQITRDERIKTLKVEIFDIIRQQEALTYQVNAYQELKKQKNQQLLELEKIKVLEAEKKE